MAHSFDSIDWKYSKAVILRTAVFIAVFVAFVVSSTGYAGPAAAVAVDIPNTSVCGAATEIQTEITTGDSIQLRWTCDPATCGFQKFRIQRLVAFANSQGQPGSYVEDSTYATYTSGRSGQFESVDGPLTPGNDRFYSYRIIHVCGSNPSSSLTPGIRLASPSELRSVLASITYVGTANDPIDNLTSGVRITWESESNNEGYLEIERSVDQIQWTPLGGVTGSARQYFDRSAKSLIGQTVYYRARGFNLYGSTPWRVSNGVRLSLPQRPTALSVGSLVFTVLTASWYDNGVNESGYRIGTTVRCRTQIFSRGPEYSTTITRYTTITNYSTQGPGTGIVQTTLIGFGGCRGRLSYSLTVWAINGLGLSAPVTYLGN